MKKISVLLVAVLIFSLFSLPFSAAEMPDVNASAYIVLNADNNQAMFGKHIDKKVDPSRLTSLAVAYLYIKNTPDLEKEVTISFNSSDSSISGRTSEKLGFKKGNTVSASTLLSAIFSNGYSDAIRALCEDLYGSDLGKAVEELNKMVQEMTLENISFVNIYGESNYEHYISVSDFAKFICEAMKNESFKNYLANSRNSFTSGEQSTSSILKYEYDYLLGGLEVKHLSSSSKSALLVSEKDGTTLISVIIDANDIEEKAEAIFDYGFDNFSYVSLTPDKIPTKQIETVQGKEFARVYFDKTLDIYLNNDLSVDNLLYSIEVPDGFSKENASVNLVITQNDDSLQVENLGIYPMKVEFEAYNTLIPDANANTSKGFSIIDLIIIIALAILAIGVAVVFWFSIQKKRRNQRKARFKKMEKLQSRSINPKDVREREEKENMRRGISSIASGVEYYGVNEDYVEPPVVVKTQRMGTNDAIEEAKKESQKKREVEAVKINSAKRRVITRENGEEVSAEDIEADFLRRTAEGRTEKSARRSVVTRENGEEISAEDIKADVLRRTNEGRNSKETFRVTYTTEDGKEIDREEVLKRNIHSVKEESSKRTGTVSAISEAEKRSEEERRQSGSGRVLTARTVIKSADGKTLERESVDTLNDSYRQKKETVERTKLLKAEKRKVEKGEMVIKEIKNPDGTVKRVLTQEGDE